MWKFSSGVGDRFLPTPVEVFFLPSGAGNTPSVDKCGAAFLEPAHVVRRGPRIFARDPDDPLVAIADGHGNEALLLERTDVGADLPLAHAEEIAEVAIGRETTAFVVERATL